MLLGAPFAQGFCGPLQAPARLWHCMLGGQKLSGRCGSSVRESGFSTNCRASPRHQFLQLPAARFKEPQAWRFWINDFTHFLASPDSLTLAIICSRLQCASSWRNSPGCWLQNCAMNHREVCNVVWKQRKDDCISVAASFRSVPRSSFEWRLPASCQHNALFP